MRDFFQRAIVAFNNYIVQIAYSLQMSSLLPIFLRRHYLRLIGVGVGVKCYFSPSISFNGRSIEFGDFCVVSSNSYLDGTGQLIIGCRVHIGFGATILTGTHAIMPSVFRRDRDQNNKLKTIIGRGCWIGSRATILPGVNVGVGCVIAAGAVVVKNCLPNGLYAGVPAIRLKDLEVKTIKPFYRGFEIDV